MELHQHDRIQAALNGSKNPNFHSTSIALGEHPGDMDLRVSRRRKDVLIATTVNGKQTQASVPEPLFEALLAAVPLIVNEPLVL